LAANEVLVFVVVGVLAGVRFAVASAA
ncbi:MAG: hypothetical protein RLZ55_275, partial [Actinomycetota bacterium]